MSGSRRGASLPRAAGPEAREAGRQVGYIYIYMIYVCVYTCMCIYIYIYIYMYTYHTHEAGKAGGQAAGQG